MLQLSRLVWGVVWSVGWGRGGLMGGVWSVERGRVGTEDSGGACGYRSRCCQRRSDRVYWQLCGRRRRKSVGGRGLGESVGTGAEGQSPLLLLLLLMCLRLHGIICTHSPPWTP